MLFIAVVMRIVRSQPALFQRFRGLLGLGVGSVLIPLLLCFLALAANPAWHQHFHQTHLHTSNSSCTGHPAHVHNHNQNHNHSYDHGSTDHDGSTRGPADSAEGDGVPVCDHCAITELGLGHAAFVLLPETGLLKPTPTSEWLSPQDAMVRSLHLSRGVSERGPPWV